MNIETLLHSFTAYVHDFTMKNYSKNYPKHDTAKADTACELIRERDGVTIKSKSIVLKNNLPKRKPATINELIIPSLQSTHAFTLKRETGKVCFSFFFKKKVV